MRDRFDIPTVMAADVRQRDLELRRMHWNCAALGVLLDGWRLSLLLKANFDPNQPRLPSGGPGGGQWTNGRQDVDADEGSARIAQAGGSTRTDEVSRRFLIDLRDFEGVNGAHTIEKHVGKSDSYLYGRMLAEKVDGVWLSMGLQRSGSFDNIVAANKLVSATLALNRTIVEQVAKGEIGDALITATFKYRTGREFYRDIPTFSFFRPKDIIKQRDVNGVGVLIIHDPSSPKGFRIHTAYPRTDD